MNSLEKFASFKDGSGFAAETVQMAQQVTILPSIFVGEVNVGRSRSRTNYRKKFSPLAIQAPFSSLPAEEGGNLTEFKRITGSDTALTRCKVPDSWMGHENTVGIIGGLSASSTAIFLAKLVWGSSRNEKECVPFIVCSDSTIKSELSMYRTRSNDSRIQLHHGVIIENLRCKMAFLEQSGARCIVMPCHVSHVWYREISSGCSVTFLNAGDCVASELKEAKLKPLEGGSRVRVGVLARDTPLVGTFYLEKLQSQGFEVVLPDNPTTEHIIIPAFEALNQKDTEGARNLLRVAIQVLLVKAVNIIILAADEFQGLLPGSDPLLKKCIDPLDSLARSAIQWARSTKDGMAHRT
ncbi:unnamed protein product [Coffea canephora]|uniref:Aspartate racemase n=1 Tax=Coffea canephora TaxID=49390 RepID=A0A068URY1_COFCA|nr:unnamed protein product [Coffea canephora]